MENEIISNIYTQFIEKWKFKPNVLFLHNAINDEKLENSVIDVYTILRDTSDRAIQSVILNAENTWINSVYLVYNQKHTRVELDHPKIKHLKINSDFEINVSDIFHSFHENAINILLNDYVVLDYHSIINLYSISANDVGILSPLLFNNEIIIDNVSLFKDNAYQPSTIISDISGIVIRGRVKKQLNYYVFEGFQNLIIESLNDLYNVSNISLITECYLFKKQEYSNNSYITNHFNINFPLIFATFIKIEDIIKQTDLNLSYEKIYNELYIPSTDKTDYSLFYNKKDIKLLDVISQIDLSKLKKFLQYNLFEEHAKLRDVMVKTNMKELEKEKNMLLTKIQISCLSQKEKIVNENTILKKQLYDDLENKVKIKQQELEEKYQQLYNEKDERLKGYEENLKSKIDLEYATRLKKQCDEIDELVSSKKLNEFNTLKINIDAYRAEHIDEIDNYIKEKYRPEKYKEVDDSLEEYKAQRETELNNLKENALLEYKKILNEQLLTERQRVSNEVKEDFLKKYEDLYTKELELLDNKISDMRKNAMCTLYSEINLVKSTMMLEIRSKRSAELDNIKKYIDEYKTQKIKEVNDEIQSNREYELSLAKLNNDIEITDYRDEKRNEVDKEIEVYRLELKNETYEQAMLQRNTLIEDNNTIISEYKEKRMASVDNEIAEYSEKFRQEKTDSILSELNQKMKDLETRYTNDIITKNAVKTGELEMDLLYKKKTMEGELEKEINASRKLLYSEIESHVENDRAKAFARLNSELELYKKSSYANLKFQHETMSLKLSEERDSQHSKLKQELLDKLQNEIYSEQSKIESEIRDLIKEKHAKEIKEIEANHLKTIEMLRIEHCDKLDDIQRNNKRIINDIEQDLIYNRLTFIEQYNKEKHAEMLKIEERMISDHNKTFDELKQTLQLFREMGIKNIEEECSKLKEHHLREVKIKYEYDNKKYLEDERLKILEKIEIFSEETKKHKMTEIQEYIQSNRTLQISKLEDEIINLKTQKLLDLEKELDLYREEQQRKVILRFSNLNKTAF